MSLIKSQRSRLLAPIIDSEFSSLKSGLPCLCKVDTAGQGYDSYFLQ